MDPKSLLKDAKRLVGRVAKVSYPTERANRLRVLRAKTANDPGAWVVFQMGKVGSTTVSASLEALSDRPHVYHSHFLTHHGIRWAEDQYRAHFSRTKALPAHVIDSLVLRERLDAGATLGWRVITLVRDPVARNLSSFFQTMYLDRPDVDLADASDAAMARLHARFIDDFDHDFPLNWLDVELGAALDIDPYAAEPDAAQGVFSLEPRGARPGLLVLTLEDLRTSGAVALARFVDCPEVPLIDANAADSKDYADAYRRFSDTIDLPESYLDRMYTSKMATHFYAEAQLEGFRRRWTR